jgi:hypothetical protein
VARVKDPQQIPHFSLATKTRIPSAFVRGIILTLNPRCSSVHPKIESSKSSASEAVAEMYDQDMEAHRHRPFIKFDHMRKKEHMQSLIDNLTVRRYKALPVLRDEISVGLDVCPRR